MSNINWNSVAKDKFHSTGRARMRQLAKALGLPEGSFDVRSNKGGPAVLGEVILHGENIYVCAGGSCSRSIYFRTCKGRRDYSGGTNNWAALDLLNNIPELARRVSRPIP